MSLKLKAFISVVLLMLIFTSCDKQQQPPVASQDKKKERYVLTRYPTPPRDKNRDPILHHCRKVGRELAQKHNLFFNGGEERVNIVTDAKDIHLDYQVFRQLNKQEARKLIVDCIQTVIKEFNDNPELKSLIPEGGYKLRNLYIHITINPDKYFVYHPNLGSVDFSFEEIAYTTFDPDRDIVWDKTRETESLEEAIALIN